MVLVVIKTGTHTRSALRVLAFRDESPRTWRMVETYATSDRSTIWSGGADLHLLIRNEEAHVPERYPSIADVRSVCNLIGVPFREDPSLDLFIVYPPLDGKLVSIRLFNGEMSDAGAELAQALVKMNRFLKVMGANVEYEDSPCKIETAHSVSLNILIYPERTSHTRGVSVLFPWWLRPIASWRLAGHLCAASGDTLPHVTRGTTFGLPHGAQRWVSESLRGSRAPSVVLIIRSLEDFIGPEIDALALMIRDGILSYYGLSDYGIVVDAITASVCSVGQPAEIHSVPAPASPDVSPSETLCSSRNGSGASSETRVPLDNGIRHEANTLIKPANDTISAFEVPGTTHQSESGVVESKVTRNGLTLEERSSQIAEVTQECRRYLARTMEGQQGQQGVVSVKPCRRPPRQSVTIYGLNEHRDMKRALGNISSPGNIGAPGTAGSMTFEDAFILAARTMAAQGIRPSPDIVVEYLSYMNRWGSKG